MEELIFGGAYVRKEKCVLKLIGLACSGKEIYHFCFVLFCIRGQIPSRGTYIRRGDLTEGFLCYDFGGLIFGGAYTWRGLFSEFYGTLCFQVSPKYSSKSTTHIGHCFSFPASRGLSFFATL